MLRRCCWQEDACLDAGRDALKRSQLRFEQYGTRAYLIALTEALQGKTPQGTWTCLTANTAW
eukprot:1041403-Amphidinium_carterae.1